MSAAAIAEMVNSGRIWRGYDQACIEAQTTDHPVLDATLPGGGWPVGGLCEIVYAGPGVGELGLLQPLLTQLTQAGRFVALLSPPHIPYAPALSQGGVRLAQVLVVDAPEPDLFWAAEQLLRAHAGAVLVWARRADAQALRRLQLAAEEVRGFVFLLHAGTLRSFSPAALRLRVQQSAGKTQVEILKCRGGAMGRKVALG